MSSASHLRITCNGTVAQIKPSAAGNWWPEQPPPQIKDLAAILDLAAGLPRSSAACLTWLELRAARLLAAAAVSSNMRQQQKNTWAAHQISLRQFSRILDETKQPFKPDCRIQSGGTFFRRP